MLENSDSSEVVFRSRCRPMEGPCTRAPVSSTNQAPMHSQQQWSTHQGRCLQGIPVSSSHHWLYRSSEVFSAELHIKVEQKSAIPANLICGPGSENPQSHKLVASPCNRIVHYPATVLEHTETTGMPCLYFAFMFSSMEHKMVCYSCLLFSTIKTNCLEIRVLSYFYNFIT